MNGESKIRQPDVWHLKRRKKENTQRKSGGKGDYKGWPGGGWEEELKKKGIRERKKNERK